MIKNETIKRNTKKEINKDTKEEKRKVLVGRKREIKENLKI